MNQVEVKKLRGTKGEIRERRLFRGPHAHNEPHERMRLYTWVKRRRAAARGEALLRRG